MNTKWFEAINSVRAGQTAYCPCCDGSNISYIETVLDKADGLGYADIWCDDCLHTFHLSRGNFKEPISNAKSKTRGLIY